VHTQPIPPPLTVQNSTASVPTSYILSWYNTTILRAISVLVCLSVSLSVCVSQKLQDQTSRNFLYVLSVAVARFCSDDSAILYVLPVLWMTSCFHIMRQIQIHRELFTVNRQVAPLDCASADEVYMSLRTLIRSKTAQECTFLIVLIGDYCTARLDVAYSGALQITNLILNLNLTALLALRCAVVRRFWWTTWSSQTRRRGGDEWRSRQMVPCSSVTRSHVTRPSTRAERTTASATTRAQFNSSLTVSDARWLDDTSLYTVSQKTSLLWLDITLTRVNGFWHFLAEVLLIK